MPELSYRGALDWLVATGGRGERLGLERTAALLDGLGRPGDGLRGVLTAGTNGKGSVCAMVESACRAAGLRTVMMTKPHLTSYRERVVLDGVPISGRAFAALVERVRPAAEAVERSEHGAPTQFEILTAIGVCAAAEHAADVLVCEVGLGGRLDSTNVLDLGVCCITAIDLDHRDRLGDSVEAIAAEKAGIVKPGDDVATVSRGPADEVIRRHAAAVGAGTVLGLGAEVDVEGEAHGLDGVAVRVRVDGVEVEARVPLPGAFQVQNAALAVTACALLGRRGIAVPPEAIVSGLAVTRWHGRLQWVRGTPAFLVDGAHNPAAMAAIVPAIREIAAGRSTVALVGCMADKDVAAMLDELRPLGASPIFTQAATPRAARAVDLARAWGPGARAIPDLPDALTAARLLAGGEGLVAVCGSIYLAGDVLQLLGESPVD